jgi:hypothetical protein
MSACASDDPRLRVAGTYRLGSITARIGDGPFTDIYEHAPTGYAIITPTRFMAVITAGGRHFGTTQADKAALFDSLIAYTGTYRIEGSNFITEVDVSWIEYFNGTDQGRTFELSADKLILTTWPAPSHQDPAVSRVARVVWERQDESV